MTLSRKDLMRWLIRKGFVELPRKSSGHRYFEMRGVKMTVPDHGKPHVNPGIISRMAQMLAPLGFDPKQVKRELLLNLDGGL